MLRIACILLFLSCNLLYSQAPKPCRDLLSGYTYISETVLGGADQVNCGTSLTAEIQLLNNHGQIDNASIYFGIDDNLDLSTATAGTSISHTTGQNFSFPQGKTWVLLKGEMGGNSVLTCKSYELLSVNQPQVATDLCTGNPISLQITDSKLRDKYKIDWGDGNVEEVSSAGSSTLANHTYSDFYSEIKVQAFYERNSSAVCTSDAVVINRDVPKPVFLSLLEGVNDASEFRLRYLGGDPAVKYRIEGKEAGSTNWQNMSDAESGEGQVIGLNAQQQYCFRLKTENSCGESFYSQNTLCTIVVDREVLSNSSMRVHWNIPTLPAENPAEMKLRKKMGTGTVTDHPLVSPTTTEFIDNGLVCGQQYLYQVEASYLPTVFEGSDVSVIVRTSFVPKEISEANVNAKPPYMAIASFDAADDSKLDFRVIIDNGGLVDNITYYKSNGISGPYTEVLTTNDNVYSETGLVPGSKNHCFKYQVKDICGVLTAPSDPFCTINLYDIKRDSIVWNEFIAPDDIFLPNSQPLYNIEYYNEDTGIYELVDSKFSDTSYFMGDFIDNLTNPVLKLRVLLNQSFSLGALNSFPINLYSNSILHTLAPRIFAPSVFTPNGSGPLETESFKIFSKFVKSGTYKILDRSGNLLFTSEGMDDSWSGSDQKTGEPLPLGTYFYIIHALSYDNKTVVVKGSVSILK